VKDSMLVEINQQAGVLKNILTNRKDPIFNKVKRIQERYKFNRIILTGSGDSYCAGLTTASTFLLQNYEAHALPPMDLSRYKYKFSQYLDKHTLLIPISVSGHTKRVIEAIHAAKSRNCPILSVTNNPDSPVAQMSDEFIYTMSAPLESIKKSSYAEKISSKYTGYEHDVPQTKSYTAVQMALQLIALSFAKDPYYDVLDPIPGVIKQTLNNSRIKKLGKKYSKASKYVFCGSGPNYGNALFGEFKMYEFAMLGIGKDIEEYCHTAYFVTDPDTPVIFLAPAGESLKRTSEIVPVLKNTIETDAVIISNKEPDFDYSYWIKIPFYGAEEFSVIPYGVVSPLLAYWSAKTLGRNVNTFRGGVEEEKYVTGSYHTIRESKVKKRY